VRFMIIVPATPESEVGLSAGTEEQFTDMQAYNAQMLRAGVFVTGEGLHPSREGARLSWADGQWTVTDGPFAEAKEIIAGFSIIDVSSREEAIEWVKRWPESCVPGAGRQLELRQVYAPEDFGEEFTPELQEREERMREEAARQAARG
jgi:hypothetical protein